VHSVTTESHGTSLLVRGARSYPPGADARAVDVRVRDGRVEAVGEDLAADGLDVLEAEGLTLIPGLVDVHVHFRDPGLEHKEGWDYGSRGALHGGVTSVVEVQNNAPLSTSLEALTARIEHVRASSRVDFGCLANLLPASVEELDAMAPLTPAFKCFLGGSTGVGGQADRETLARLFAAAAAAGRMVVAHCEDEDLLRASKRAHPNATAADHHLVRSSAAEVESVRTSIALCRETGAELHVFHLSTAEGARLVAEAREEGLRVSASTAPHYLLLDEVRVAELGNFGKVNPSIKTAADAAALVEALRSGVVDAIGTDHAPHSLEEKLRDYAHAPSGMPSVDLLWPLTWELVRRGLLEPEVALASVTERAADTLHLPGKGRLAPGFDGDLVLFDPEELFVVRGAELPSRSRWSAYEGWELAGPPRIVVRRGEVCLRDGQLTVTAGGRPLDLQPL
jgi:dihydroorotase